MSGYPILLRGPRRKAKARKDDISDHKYERSVFVEPTSNVLLTCLVLVVNP